MMCGVSPARGPTRSSRVQVFEVTGTSRTSRYDAIEQALRRARRAVARETAAPKDVDYYIVRTTAKAAGGGAIEYQARVEYAVHVEPRPQRASPSPR